MEGYFGNNSSFNHDIPPLNLTNDNNSLVASPRDYDLLARVRHYDESVMLRYLLSTSSTFDENVSPRNRPIVMSSNQLRRLSSSSSGGSSSSRGSPLSSLDNVEISPLRRSGLASSAVKIEEDVLVMDAIPVRSVARSVGVGRSRRLRSPLSLSTHSGALQSSSSVSSYSGMHKREICPSWDEHGICRYGAKCMFAHGKEEIDPRFASKTKSEVNMSKSPSNTTLVNGQKNFSSDKPLTETNLKEMTTSMPSGDGTILSKEQERNRASSPCSVKDQDWSPLDDLSELTLPYPAKGPPSREAVNEYIGKILYGARPTEKKRLRIFEEICPSDAH